MTNQTKKEIATVITILGAIFGAPMLSENNDSSLLDSMHEEIYSLSEKIDGLRHSDSLMSISYAHISTSVDSLVIRARVEDGIKKAMLETLNKQHNSIDNHAENETQIKEAKGRPNKKRYEDLLEALYK
jgi:hypothetical protein